MDLREAVPETSLGSIYVDQCSRKLLAVSKGTQSGFPLEHSPEPTGVREAAGAGDLLDVQWGFAQKLAGMGQPSAKNLAAQCVSGRSFKYSLQVVGVHLEVGGNE